MHPPSPVLHRGILLFLLLIGSVAARAQVIENLKVTFDGQNVYILYDLVHQNPAEKFKVSIFSSHDNYTIPLSFVNGEVGENILPGKAKQVVWNVKNVLPPDFDGELTFRIRATGAAAERLSIKALSKRSYKRGQPVDIQWTGGSSRDLITIQLYRGSELKGTVVQKSPNLNSYTWQMPKGQKPGKGYTLRVATEAQPNEFVTTESFQVKPTIPGIAKVGVLAVVGVGAYVLLSGGDPAPPVDQTSDELPGPKKPQ